MGILQKTKEAVTEVLKEAVDKVSHMVAPDEAGLQASTTAPLSMQPQSPARQKAHSFRRKLIGVVVSDKMNKTVVVEVNRYSRDRVYKKYVKRRIKYKAHDEKNEFKMGDRVEIQEHSPYSREKRFKVVRLVSRSVEA